MQIKDILKAYREKMNISQQTLADNLNISRSVVAKWEIGLVFPSDNYLQQLADFFHIPMEELTCYKTNQELSIRKNQESFTKWLKEAKQSYMVSYMKNKGLIGGFLYLGEFTITYKTNKLQFPKEIRYFEIPFCEISSVIIHKFVITILTITKEEYRFLLYRPNKMRKALRLRHELIGDIEF